MPASFCIWRREVNTVRGGGEKGKGRESILRALRDSERTEWIERITTAINTVL